MRREEGRRKKEKSRKIKRGEETSKKIWIEGKKDREKDRKKEKEKKFRKKVKKKEGVKARGSKNSNSVLMKPEKNEKLGNSD